MGALCAPPPPPKKKKKKLLMSEFGQKLGGIRAILFLFFWFLLGVLVGSHVQCSPNPLLEKQNRFRVRGPKKSAQVHLGWVPPPPFGHWVPPSPRGGGGHRTAELPFLFSVKIKLWSEWYKQRPLQSWELYERLPILLNGATVDGKWEEGLCKKNKKTKHVWYLYIYWGL